MMKRPSFPLAICGSPAIGSDDSPIAGYIAHFSGVISRASASVIDRKGIEKPFILTNGSPFVREYKSFPENLIP